MDVFGRLFNAILGLVSHKVRSLYVANKLLDGDLTHGKYKKLITRHLDDIKSELEGLSRKDLYVSICFLKEGVQRLQMSLGESSDSENSTTSYELPKDNAVALSTAILKLNIESSVRFECAKECFRNARNEAARAFHNAALSISERILASKLCIVSGILKNLDDPELAASDCFFSVQELHLLPAIKEMFSVHLGEGIKSLFYRMSRTENVQSVTMMNLILADFISKFTKRRMAVFDWPMIECGKRVVHPIHYKKENEPNGQEMEITPPWDIVVLKEEDIGSGVLNNKADLVGFFSGKDDKHGVGKLNRTTGEVQLFSSSPSKNIKTENIEYSCVAVDEDGMVYFLSWYDDVGYKLSVYTEDGIIKHHCELNVRIVRQCCHIAVTKDKKIVICCEDDRGEITVYLCKISDDQEPQIESFTTGLMNHSIERVFVSCDNEIIVATINVTKPSHVLYTYTEDGKLHRAIKFHPSEGNNYYLSVCYDQVTKNIIGFNVANSKIFVEYLSGETGKLEHSYVLFITDILENPSFFRLACHRNGALALVSSKRVLFLQAPSKESMTFLKKV